MLGLTSEIFYEACLTGRNSRNINRNVYEKLIALDDFLTFKKIMVKRNAELELETFRAYRSVGPGDTSVFGADDEEEYEASLKIPSSLHSKESDSSFRDDLDTSMVSTEEEVN